MNIRENIISRFIGIMMLLSVIIIGSSCDDDFTTDDSSFAVYYTSLTDIGPSMTGVIASPTYKGAQPTDFTITGIKFVDNENTTSDFTGELFTIDNTTGAISFNSTKETQVGTYIISVKCSANGVVYTLNDAVSVKFLQAVPDGIIVDPNFLEVKLSTVTNKRSLEKLPTAQVTTENTSEHVSILDYKISNVVRMESDESETFIDNNRFELFSINENGLISINKSDDYDESVIKGGLYRIDLRLTTAAIDPANEQEGLFTDAIRVNLTDKPSAISYKDGVIEAGVEGDESKPRGAFESQKPLIEGSPVNAEYEITKITKASDSNSAFASASEEEKAFFSIDQTSGVISVPNTHTFALNNIFKVSVKVTNPDGEFIGEDALTLYVDDWVAPINTLTYENGEFKKAMSFTSAHPNTDSEYLEYSLVNLPEEYEEFIKINKTTGQVNIEKYNTLAEGEFKIQVNAKNFKSELQGELTVNVLPNENYFDLISYGSNIAPADMAAEAVVGSIYDNQYRFTSDEEMTSIEIKPLIEIEGAKWSIKGMNNQQRGADIDKATGVIKLHSIGTKWEDWSLGLFFVEATKGEGENSFSRTYPLFVNYSKAIEGVNINYTPFVFRVNPKTGGKSVTPEIDKTEGFLMDYRRDFCYYNLNGVRTDGDFSELESGNIKSKSETNPFLQHLWDANKAAGNYGNKKPVAYFDGEKAKKSSDLMFNTLLYIDNAENSTDRFAVIVNKNKWYDNGWADGVFIAQVTFTKTGKTADMNNKIIPIAIWLDKSLKE